MNQPPCPRCGAPAVWKAQANGWGCDRCQQMLPPPPVAQAVQMCPRCGAPAVWHAQVSRWGCDRCRDYLDAMKPAFAAAPDVAAKRALAMRRIGVGLVLLVIGVVITVATHDEAERNGRRTY